MIESLSYRVWFMIESLSYRVWFMIESLSYRVWFTTKQSQQGYSVHTAL